MGVPLGFWQGWLVHEIIFGLLRGFSVIQSFEKAFLSFYICPSLLPSTQVVMEKVWQGLGAGSYIGPPPPLQPLIATEVLESWRRTAK